MLCREIEEMNEMKQKEKSYDEICFESGEEDEEAGELLSPEIAIEFGINEREEVRSNIDFIGLRVVLRMTQAERCGSRRKVPGESMEGSGFQGMNRMNERLLNVTLS